MTDTAEAEHSLAYLLTGITELHPQLPPSMRARAMRWADEMCLTLEELRAPVVVWEAPDDVITGRLVYVGDDEIHIRQVDGYTVSRDTRVFDVERTDYTLKVVA